MAKWGEGDPRWIVEERPDATNVNNWHWSEKDASGWSKAKLKGLLIGLSFDGEEGSCAVEEVVSCTGEATASNRKGRLIFFYEWNIKLKWNGTVLDDNKKFSGEIEIPNLSEENDIDEINVIVTVTKVSKTSQKLKELVHKVAPDTIRDQLAEYVRCLKEEYSQNLILPRKDGGSPAQRSSPVPDRKDQPDAPSTSSKPAARQSASSVGYRIPTSRLKMTETFKTSIEDLYHTLTSQELVESFTRGKAVVEARRGGLYSILGGNISGEFVEAERPSKIVQRWRERSWPDGHYSTVTMELTQEADHSAKLTLVQTGVPAAATDRTKEGWRRHIFESIKTTFGYGARLF